MFSQSSSSLFPSGPRRTVWLIVFALVAGDAWLAAKYWPSLSGPLRGGIAQPVRAATTTHLSAPPPINVHRNVAGTWNITGKGVEMVAQPELGGTYVCRVLYTTAGSDLLAEWQTLRRLRTLLGAASRNPRAGGPLGLSADQVTRLRPLLVNLQVAISDPQLQTLQADMAALGAKAGRNTVNSPDLLADERKIVEDLDADSAADLAAGQPALRARVAQVQAIMGIARWNQLAAARVVIGRGQTTRPSHPAAQRTYTH